MLASSPALTVDSASAELSADLTVTRMVPGGMPLNCMVPPEDVRPRAQPVRLLRLASWRRSPWGNDLRRA